MNFICFNNRYLSSKEPLFVVQNRGFKYGDGIFETMMVRKGKLLFSSYHEERLHTGLALLKINITAPFAALSDHVLRLCEMNGCAEAARVRLAVYREEDHSGSFVIAAEPLSEPSSTLAREGLSIDIFPHVRKSTDAFANIKTANFLPYVMAGIYAKENHLDDSIVLNTEQALCDTSKANIFLVKGNTLYTPSLDQGCISGVMRRYLIEALKHLQLPVHQTRLEEQDLFDADEVFITNVIIGIRWVSCFREKRYAHQLTRFIYERLLTTIYQ